MLAPSLLNANRRYYLAGEVWQRNHRIAVRRLTLERYDGAEDSAFFLYFAEQGFIGRITEKTLAKPTKFVEFNRGRYRVKVLRSSLLEALEAVS